MSINLFTDTLINDFDRAFNGAEVLRTYKGKNGNRLLIGKREHSPTGKHYVVTNMMFNEGKYSFYWSTYDIESFSEACDIATNNI